MGQENRSGPAEVTIPLGGGYPRGAQLLPLSLLGSTDLDLIGGGHDLPRSNFWAQPRQIRLSRVGWIGQRFFFQEGHFVLFLLEGGVPGLLLVGQHPFPIGPRDSLGRSGGRGLQGRLHRSRQFGRPGRMAARGSQGDQVGLELAEVLLGLQGLYLGQLGLPDGLAMLLNQGAYFGVRDHLFLLSLPAQQAGGGGEGKLLGQQAGPLLQAPGNDHALVLWEHRGKRQEVGLAALAVADLLSQVQDPQAAGNLEIRFAVEDGLAVLVDMLVRACQDPIEEFPLLEEDRTHDLPSLFQGIGLQLVNALLTRHRQEVQHLQPVGVQKGLGDHFAVFFFHTDYHFQVTHGGLLRYGIAD